MLNAYSVGGRGQGQNPAKFFPLKYNQILQHTGRKIWCLPGPALRKFK
jgi:hypothetical protein